MKLSARLDIYIRSEMNGQRIKQISRVAYFVKTGNAVHLERLW